MKELETERLILRHIVASDAPDIFEYAREPEVGSAAGWKPHVNIGETRSIMDDIFIGKENVFGIVPKASGKVAGSIGLIPDPHRSNPSVLMLGYALSKSWWGKGLMTEAAKAIVSNAFRELPIDTISCTCYSTNSRSRRVILKCGFEYEGCLRRGERRYDGTVFDLECYSMFKRQAAEL
ncbi:MAG: GNAT family N-acetyltransferase [Bacteroidales bacterium]|nr:GNAT family N-acetyltransferase [Bacteroidales bacterium]